MKCKVTCVKVWMGLAVAGCVITLILAAVVLSSYSFESVIGPLPCKLHQIETTSCCYDEDCIYGKQYIYHFSSNTSHCMDKFDLYNNPHNTSVRFREETGCYPSLNSLDGHAPMWARNDSVIFYVNHECTQWLESSVHSDHVNTNIMWIAIILSFVGCSCISMICGFITMYSVEIVSCLVQYCSCSDCDKYLYDLDEYDSDDTSKPNQIDKKHRLSSFTNSTSESPAKKADRERLKPSPPSPIAVVSKGDHDNSRSIHFNNVNHMFQLQPPVMEDGYTVNRNGSDHTNYKRKYSKESQISRLSPIIMTNEFLVSRGKGKICSKNREYTSPHAGDTDTDEDKATEMDEDDLYEDDSEYKSTNRSKEVMSTGILSDGSVHYDNEWYEDASMCTRTTKSRKQTDYDF